jgi:DNA-binding CsgD family transcriptional regulator
LSERELEVLRLIAGGASNHAIAAALVISLGTVKSHINHILGKLAASNRTEAIARARIGTADQLTSSPMNGATLPRRFMRLWIVLWPWLTPISCEGITWRHQIFSHSSPLHCYAGTS